MGKTKFDDFTLKPSPKELKSWVNFIRGCHLGYLQVWLADPTEVHIDYTKVVEVELKRREEKKNG
jgi:hypothetical protein